MECNLCLHEHFVIGIGPIFSFSCSFQQKSYPIKVFAQNSGVGATHLENSGSATDRYDLLHSLLRKFFFSQHYLDYASEMHMWLAKSWWLTALFTKSRDIL